MILYHYCSTSTLESIVKGKGVWLSSLLASNDTQEGRWLSHVLNSLCRKLRVHPKTHEALRHVLARLEEQFDCLGLCLSEEGDMLSQWRGYGDNAAGFSIGFDKEALDALCQKTPSLGWPNRLHPVIYDEVSQEALLAPALEKVLGLVVNNFIPPTVIGFDSVRFKTYEEAVKAFEDAQSHVSLEMSGWITLFYVTKNPAFREEREWRVVQQHIVGNADVEYRARGSVLVPYINLPLQAEFWPTIIKKVILGPRNHTPIAVVEGFLRKNGCKAEVEQSISTYR